MAPSDLSPTDMLTRIAAALQSLHVPYAVTGSMASMYYGEMRTTNDVDVVADLQLDQVNGLLAQFPQDDFYASEEAALQAIRSRGQFNIIHPTSGLKIDVIIPGDEPHDRLQLSRAQEVMLPTGVGAQFAAPEDVILKKLQFFQMGGSEKHLRDIASMLKVYGARLEHHYLDDWAERLNVPDEWQLVKKRVAES